MIKIIAIGQRVCIFIRSRGAFPPAPNQYSHPVMKYLPTVLITSTEQLLNGSYQSGQWIQLAWCEKPSRFHSATARNVKAFHYPVGVSGFNSFCSACKPAKGEGRA